MEINNEKMIPATECEMTIRVRYAECDPFGYLHHSVYLTYFEMGRTELLRVGGFRYRDIEEQGRVVRPSTRPGLGIEIDEDEVKKHPFQQEELQRVFYSDDSVGDW